MKPNEAPGTGVVEKPRAARLDASTGPLASGLALVVVSVLSSGARGTELLYTREAFDRSRVRLDRR